MRGPQTFRAQHRSHQPGRDRSTKEWPGESPVQRWCQRGASVWTANQSPRTNGGRSVGEALRNTSRGGPHSGPTAPLTNTSDHKGRQAQTTPQGAGGRRGKRHEREVAQQRPRNGQVANRKPHKTPRSEERQHQAPRCEPPALVLGALACRSNTAKAMPQNTANCPDTDIEPRPGGGTSCQNRHGQSVRGTWRPGSRPHQPLRKANTMKCANGEAEAT